MRYGMVVGCVAIAIAALACSRSNSGRSNGDASVGDAGGGDGFSADNPYPNGNRPGCVGLECQQVTCAGGAKTTLTGKVYAPNGTLPLYNAIVYVPNSKLDPFPAGVTCDRCNGHVSGDPVAQTLSGADGSFTLPDVPVGENIPLVVELGKWRRQITVASVPKCMSTPLSAGMVRLPKNHTEGDLPLMAIATGHADPMECLLLKMGIDASEIQEPSANTRVQFYKGDNQPGTLISGSTPDVTTMTATLSAMEKYDIIMLPCEGGEYTQSNVGNLVKYLNDGGRVFATHYSYDWLTYTSPNNSPYNQIANPMGGKWPVGQVDDYSNTIDGGVVTSFAKGQAFAQWLKAAGAASPQNILQINQGRHDVTSVDSSLAQPWVLYDFRAQNGGTSSPAVMHFTFNTPLDAGVDDMGQKAYCGRTVFSDFHVSAAALSDGGANKTFPSACNAQEAMSDQEKALAFMLFDLSSCVQADTTPPIQ